MKTYKNFLPEHNFKEIQEVLMSNSFPYYKQKWVGTPDDVGLSCLFTHLLVYNGEKQTGEDIQHLVMHPIINRLAKIHRVIKVVRAKINLYPYQSEHMKSTYHIDQSTKHKVLLLPINTNNGYTEFENGKIFNAVENNAIIFDGKERHRSVSQTDNSAKINININYEVYK
tara:strand:+ start:97 stop:606 length:510 start_codon:yes stop_codon:yes gene_type:complete